MFSFGTCRLPFFKFIFHVHLVYLCIGCEIQIYFYFSKYYSVVPASCIRKYLFIPVTGNTTLAYTKFPYVFGSNSMLSICTRKFWKCQSAWPRWLIRVITQFYSGVYPSTNINTAQTCRAHSFSTVVSWLLLNVCFSTQTLAPTFLTP